jgi:hypothetical protein
MKREWFQNKPCFPHYDLVPTRRAVAIRYGAVERELRDYLRERKGLSVPCVPSAPSPTQLDLL